MELDRWQKVEEILGHAWSLPAAEQDAHLEKAAQGDTTLLRELRELSEASKAAEDWPDPAVPVASHTRFGPYEVERLVGRGGMGAVYLAHRADGQFEQKVAVKVVGLPFEVEELQERFRRERQILAGLNHPNITRLLDGGISSDGSLYLAMEYVDGLSIEQYCAKPGLSIARKVSLFRQVCSAVEYAHRNLIVHRDIKPSNILVTAEGTPKLLDFGTARLFKEADQTQTLLGPMTELYASPEQVRGEPVTTLSDVYSLGLVLFEILTGVKRFISPRSSAGTSPLIFPSGVSVSPDLTRVVSKSLAEEPAERYSSVEQLSEDLRRYLEGEPVLAHPPSLWYQGTKFARRHKLALIAAGLALVALMAGVVTIRQAQLRAERRFAEVRQLANYLVFDIHDGLQRVPGSTQLEKQVVERSLQYLDRLSSEASHDTALRLELAAAYQKLGDVLGNPFLPSMGDRKAALAIYPKALALAKAALAQDPGNLTARQWAASTELQLGGANNFGGDRKAGLAQTAAAINELEQLAREAPDNFDVRLSLAKGLSFQGNLLMSNGAMMGGDPVEVEKAYNRAASNLAYLVKRHPNDPKVLQMVAQNEANHGNLWGSTDPVKAVGYFQNGLDALNHISEEEQQGLDLRRLRAAVLKSMGFAQGQLGDYDAAIRNTNRAGVILEVLATADPANASALYQVTAVYRNRGLIRKYKGDFRGAIEEFEHAAELHRQLSERDPSNAIYKQLRADLLARVGSLYVSLGQPSLAKEKTATGMQVMKQLADLPGASLTDINTACSWFGDAMVVSLRDPKIALPFCQRAVDLTQGKDPDALFGMAVAKYHNGDRNEALAILDRAIALLPPTEPGKPKSQQRINFARTRADIVRGR